jgi:hypothetical protein
MFLNVVPAIIPPDGGPDGAVITTIVEYFGLSEGK